MVGVNLTMCFKVIYINQFKYFLLWFTTQIYNERVTHHSMCPDPPLTLSNTGNIYILNISLSNINSHFKAQDRNIMYINIV